MPRTGWTSAASGLPGILVSGIAWNYLAEALGEEGLAGHSTCCASPPTRCPSPRSAALLDASREVHVVEEGQPFIERCVSALGLMRERRILGKLSGRACRAWAS